MCRERDWRAGWKLEQLCLAHSFVGAIVIGVEVDAANKTTEEAGSGIDSTLEAVNDVVSDRSPCCLTNAHIPVIRNTPWTPLMRTMAELTEAFSKHGDIVEVKGFFLRVFCFRNPRHIEHIFRHKDVGNAKLPEGTPGIKAFIPRNVVMLRNSESARNQRKLLLPAFKEPHISRYLECTVAHIDALISSWSHREHSEFDCYDELQRATTKLGFQMFLSCTLSEPELSALHGQFKVIDAQLMRRFPPILPIGQDRRFRRAKRTLHRVVRQQLRTRRQSPIDKQDLLGHLLQIQREHQLCDDTILDELLGHTNSIRLVTPPVALGLALLALYPHIQDQLRASLSGAFEASCPPSDSLSKNSFLDMTVSEILRHYPSTWVIPRFVRTRFMIEGFAIPGGSVVVPMIYHTHFHPGFWEHPQTFEPRRFAPEKRKTIHPYAHLAFSKGGRSCMGAGLAVEMIKIMLAKIVRRFEIELVRPFQLDPIERHRAGFNPGKPTLIRIRQITD
jgi:cytochrome P450